MLPLASMRQMRSVLSGVKPDARAFANLLFIIADTVVCAGETVTCYSACMASRASTAPLMRVSLGA